LVAALLAVRRHTPLRLMRFLDDARRQAVLVAVGSAYQFRYSDLQRHLAVRATAQAVAVGEEPPRDLQITG
jgi:hypothetical protein